MEVSFIFIGDTHGFIDDFSKQKEVIELVNPDFVLSEKMEDVILMSDKDFTEIFKKEKISNMTSMDEVMSLIKLCKLKKIKLIGIDLKNFGFNKILQDKIKKQSILYEEEKIMNSIIDKREENQLKKILEYSKKTSKPIIVILGAWHLRGDSPILKNLDNYKIIFPCDKEGNLLIYPPKDGKAKYCEKIKCQKN